MNNHLNYTFCFPWETGSFRSKRAFSMNSRFSRRRRKERNDWTRNREKNTIPRKLLFDVLQLLLFKELYERQLLGYCLGECCREQRQEAQGRIVRAFCSNWTWWSLMSPRAPIIWEWPVHVRLVPQIQSKAALWARRHRFWGLAISINILNSQGIEWSFSQNFLDFFESSFQLITLIDPRNMYAIRLRSWFFLSCWTSCSWAIKNRFEILILVDLSYHRFSYRVSKEY